MYTGNGLTWWWLVYTGNGLTWWWLVLGSWFYEHPHCTTEIYRCFSSDKCTYCKSLWIKHLLNALHVKIRPGRRLIFTKLSPAWSPWCLRRAASERPVQAVLGAETEAVSEIRADWQIDWLADINVQSPSAGSECANPLALVRSDFLGELK